MSINSIPLIVCLCLPIKYIEMIVIYYMFHQDDPSTYSKKAPRLEDLDGIVGIEDIEFDNDLFSINSNLYTPEESIPKSYYTDRLFGEESQPYYLGSLFKETSNKKKRVKRSMDITENDTTKSKESLSLDLSRWLLKSAEEKESFVYEYAKNIEKYISDKATTTFDADGFISGMQSIHKNFLKELSKFMEKEPKLPEKIPKALTISFKQAKIVKRTIKVPIKEAISDIIKYNQGKATKDQIVTELTANAHGEERDSLAASIANSLYKNFDKIRAVYKLKPGIVVSGSEESVKERLYYILSQMPERSASVEMIKQRYRDVYGRDCKSEYWESAIFKALSSSEGIDKESSKIYYRIK